MANKITCNVCGKTIGDNQKVCPSCGTEVKKESPVSERTVYGLPTAENGMKFKIKLVRIIAITMTLLVALTCLIINFTRDDDKILSSNKKPLYILRKNVSDEQSVIYIECGGKATAKQFRDAEPIIIERIKSYDPSAEISQTENRITIKSDKTLYTEDGEEKNIFGVDGTFGLAIDDYEQEKNEVCELDKKGILSVKIVRTSGYALSKELRDYSVIDNNISMWSDVYEEIADELSAQIVKVTVNETEANKIKSVIETAAVNESSVLAVSDCSDLSTRSLLGYSGTKLGMLYPVPGADFKEFYIRPENVSSAQNAALIKNVIEGPIFKGKMYTDDNPMYYGFMDNNGKVVIELKYDSLKQPTDGLIVAQKDGKWGCINEKGKEVFDFEFDTIDNFYDGFAAAKKGGRWGVINSKGKTVINFKYEKLLVIGNKIFLFKSDGKWGLSDLNGKILVENQYENVGLASNHIVSVKKAGKWGGIDKNGKVVIPFKYDYSFAFIDEKLAPVCKDGKYGYIDITGKLIIPFEYSYASSFIDGIAVVKQHDKFGYINESGDTIIPFMYDWATPFDEGIACVTEDFDDPSYYIDTKGEVFLEPGYEDIENFVDGLALVYDDGKEFYINKKGKQVGPSFKVF